MHVWQSNMTAPSNQNCGCSLKGAIMNNALCVSHMFQLGMAKAGTSVAVVVCSFALQREVVPFLCLAEIPV